MATSTVRGLFVDVKILNHDYRVQQAKSTGMVEISFIHKHLKLRRTLNNVVVSDHRRTTLRPELFLQAPNQVLLHPPLHKNFLFDFLSTLNLLICSRCSRDHAVEFIASCALCLAAAPTGLIMGCFMAVELQYFKVEHFAGASRSAIEKGGFVVEKSDQELGMCSILFELLRMDRSHIYHQSCILPWLEKHNTCPQCHRKVEGEE